MCKKWMKNKDIAMSSQNFSKRHDCKIVSETFSKFDVLMKRVYESGTVALCNHYGIIIHVQYSSGVMETFNNDGSYVGSSFPANYVRPTIEELRDAVGFPGDV